MNIGTEILLPGVEGVDSLPEMPGGMSLGRKVSLDPTNSNPESKQG